MKIFFENTLSQKQREQLLLRPIVSQVSDGELIQKICSDIKKRGDSAVKEYAKLFDHSLLESFCVSMSEFEEAQKIVSIQFKTALAIASSNITKFHSLQQRLPYEIETMPGILCRREIRPLETVGLYVPAGSAPLPSTVLMLGIPAKLAGCSRILFCSPPTGAGTIDPFVLVAAQSIGITEVYKVGGAQAIAALAYGTESIPKVDKVFGPGNKYVAAAKQFVSNDPQGASIDILAGPSEVLVLADETAKPDIVAVDLISQAEHDPDARAVLVTTSTVLAQKVKEILPSIAALFQRNVIIRQSLDSAYAIVVDSMESAIQFSNDYAPEHLILNTNNAEAYISSIRNAGSVFIGPFSPVTAGDYASGTNHTLPTSGTSRWFSGLSIESFQKTVTFQSLTKEGLARIAPSLEEFAIAEGLQAHAKAVTDRLSL